MPIPIAVVAAGTIAARLAAKKAAQELAKKAAKKAAAVAAKKLADEAKKTPQRPVSQKDMQHEINMARLENGRMLTPNEARAAARARQAAAEEKVLRANAERNMKTPNQIKTEREQNKINRERSDAALRDRAEKAANASKKALELRRKEAAALKAEKEAKNVNAIERNLHVRTRNHDNLQKAMEKTIGGKPPVRSNVARMHKAELEKMAKQGKSVKVTVKNPPVKKGTPARQKYEKDLIARMEKEFKNGKAQ